MEKITSILIRARTQIKEFLSRTEKKKLIILAVIAFAVIAASIAGAVMLNRVQYTTLYSGLSADEAGTIMGKLEEMGVPGKADGTDSILVPEEQADELRIKLASQGYPNTGLNYDLFSNSSSLGSTDLEQQTYLQYQLQENMRKTISHMNKVSDCIVMVNLPSKSSFVVTDNTSEASVAVLLELKNGEKLSEEEVGSISKFVLKCVPNLKEENISIVDSQMNSYSIGGEESEKQNSNYSESQQQLTEQMKKILTDQAMRVLQPAVGSDNVAVSVNLNLNFDKETENSVDFSPPVEGESQGLLISSQEIYDGVGGNGSAASGQAGTDSNGVSASEYVSGDQNKKDSESFTKTYNYQLSQIQSQIEKAQGTVKDLSVAVLVNGDVEGINGYQDKIKSLVANAIGVEPDYISVEVIPFQESPMNGSFEDYLTQNQKAMDQMTRNSMIKAGILAAAAILIALMIISYLRWKHKLAYLNEVSEQEALMAAESEAAQDIVETENPEYLLQEMMNKKSDETEKVEELMEKYPEAVVQTLRSWLLEDK